MGPGEYALDKVAQGRSLNRAMQNTPAPATPRDTVGAALNREYEALAEVSKALSELEQRLNPVLLPSAGNDVNKCMSEPDATNVKSLVDYNVYKIRGLRDRVIEIAERLEL